MLTSNIVSSSYPYTNKQARASLARNGKSFNWASHLFSRKDFDRVANLYAFCRFVDDIADNLNEVQARLKLEAIYTDIKRGDSDIPQVKALLDLLRGNDDALKAACILVAALFSDTGKVRIQNWDHLIRYAYGVAGTVGIMMCAVVGDDDPRALPFAIDLGIGMQLTNIARDVVEDAYRNRIYLPADAFDVVVEPGDLLKPALQDTFFPVVKTVLETADKYYRSANYGMRFLPLRSRLVIMTAARIYHQIGPRILNKPGLFWRSRIYVDHLGKLYQTLKAIVGLTVNPRYWHVGRVPVHDARLHRSIRDLPGANRREYE